MLYGASYYYEYQPYERLLEDARLMREAGLSVVRLGESTWASWEPEDGIFEYAWMDRVIDTLHHHDLKVVFGTPTYAIPPWMARKHPFLLAQHARGQRAWYGGRQNMDFTHPVFRAYAERIIRNLVERYAPHPAVVGFQLDNETGSGPLYNPHVFTSFVAWLQKRHHHVDALNTAWGLTYWSHRLGDWDDLWTPDGNTNPGYDLEWRRFQAALVTDYLCWQRDIARPLMRPDQFVTQNVVPVHGRGEADVYAIAGAMDVLAINPYHATQDALDLTQHIAPADSGTPDWLDRYSSQPGVWTMVLNSDFARGAGGGKFLVTELNATSIGGPHTNFPAYDGQWRLAAWHFVARGAQMIAYWHWHTLHYGHETYWGGILGHDLEPGRCYNEISRIASELRQHDKLLTRLMPAADVAFLYSQDSKYALEFMPALGVPGTKLPERHTYQTIFDTFYRGFFDARAQAVIVHEAQDFAAWPLVVVPALYIADDDLLERLADYAHAGGHVLLTLRSGCADRQAQVRHTRAPGPLRPAAGVSYQEFSNLTRPLPLLPGETDFVPAADARATLWADGLIPEGAQPLAWYDHPHHGRFPAAVTHAWGAGRVTWCGTLPNEAFACGLAGWAMQRAGIQTTHAGLPRCVRSNTAHAADGRRIHFFMNWSWDAQTIHPDVGGQDIFTGAPVRANEPLTLGGWDVRIIVSEHDRISA
jgi:beta-galactosidase